MTKSVRMEERTQGELLRCPQRCALADEGKLRWRRQAPCANGMHDRAHVVEAVLEDSPARSWAGIGCVFGDLVDDSGRHARGEVDSFEIEAVGDLVTRATRCGVKDRQPGRAGHNTPARPRDESRACSMRRARASQLEQRGTSSCASTSSNHGQAAY